MIDAGDYVAWRKSPASNGGTPAYDNPAAPNFGNAAGAGSGLGSNNSTVPEPGTILLAAAGFLLRASVGGVSWVAKPLDLKERLHIYPAALGGPPACYTAAMRRYPIAALTGVSLSLAPLMRVWQGQAQAWGPPDWILVSLSFLAIYIVPEFYMRFASEVVAELTKADATAISSEEVLARARVTYPRRLRSSHLVADLAETRREKKC